MPCCFCCSVAAGCNWDIAGHHHLAPPSPFPLWFPHLPGLPPFALYFPPCVCAHTTTAPPPHTHAHHARALRAHCTAARMPHAYRSTTITTPPNTTRRAPVCIPFHLPFTHYIYLPTTRMRGTFFGWFTRFFHHYRIRMRSFPVPRLVRGWIPRTGSRFTTFVQFNAILFPLPV